MDGLIGHNHDEEEIESCGFYERRKWWEQMHNLEETRLREGEKEEQIKEKGRYRLRPEYRSRPEVSVSDSSDAETILTPGTSNTFEPLPKAADYDGATVHRDAVPQPGNTYILIDKELGRPITLVDGKLQLQPDSCAPGNCHWVYVESTNWIGFRNEASSTFLGHDNKKRIRASQSRQKGWECWIIRPCPDGGYFLMHTYGDWLLYTAVDVDGQSLISKEAEGAAWEFVKV